jgi:tRNA pseudouridine38-40 synthase
LGKRYVWWIKDQLDSAKMNEVARHFTGLKNYKSFTDDDQEQASSKTNIMHSAVTDHGDLIVFHVIGSHFLWKQVRRMIGVLVEAGRGKLDAGEVNSFFRNKSDIPAKLTAPPSGLFLEHVYYKGEKFNLDIKPVINI